MAAPRVFVSHASDDAELAAHVIELLRAALPLGPEDIRCTSVDGYRLPGGADTDEALRTEVGHAEIFIGIISEASLRSLYVAFELGGRWALRKHLLPLLAPGTPADVLSGPLAGVNALRADSRAQLLQMVREVGQSLSLSLSAPDSYSRHVDAVVSVPKKVRVATGAETARTPAARVPHPSDLEVDNLWAFDDVDLEIDGIVAVQGAYTQLWWPSASGNWTSTIARGAYRLSNSGAKDDRHWVVFTPPRAHAFTDTPVSVEVQIESASPAFGTGCGIIHRFNERPSSFCSLMVIPYGQIRFSVSLNREERELYKNGHVSLQSSGFVKLLLVPSMDDFFFFVGDTFVSRVRQRKLPGGGIGILASGRGEFAFRNFTVYRRWR